MHSEITLLDASLLGDGEKLREISYWLRVMNRPNGWHYDLDRIWILNELEKAGVAPGSTVLDAGAGQGDMQYLLAARGYNVISLDFSPRTKPPHAAGIFNVIGQGDAKIEYEHPYMKFISYGSRPSSVARKLLQASTWRKLPRLPQRVARHALSSLFYLFERFARRHDSYGTVTYLRAPFHDVPLQSACVDAVISISAIEHADIDLFERNMKELIRLLKPNAPLLLTTSATDGEKNFYHQKTAGWCYSLSALKNFFPGCKVAFEPERCARSLIESKVFRDRLDPYYYQDKDAFCHRKRIANLPYMPVAIKVTA